MSIRSYSSAEGLQDVKKRSLAFTPVSCHKVTTDWMVGKDWASEQVS